MGSPSAGLTAILVDAGGADEVGPAPLFRGRDIGPAFGDEQPRLAARQRQPIADVVPRQVNAVERVGVFPQQADRCDLVGTMRRRPPIGSWLAQDVSFCFHNGSLVNIKSNARAHLGMEERLISRWGRAFRVRIGAIRFLSKE
jgi:hypothetical protein